MCFDETYRNTLKSWNVVQQKIIPDVFIKSAKQSDMFKKEKIPFVRIYLDFCGVWIFSD